MDRARWWLISGLVILAALLAAGAAVGGDVGFLAVATYLLLVLLPGAALLVAVWSRWGEDRPTFAQGVFHSNVFGLTLAVGGGWLLARSGVFSLAGTALVELAVVSAAWLLARSHLRNFLVRLHRDGLPRARDEALYLGALGATAVLLLLPIWEVLAQGNLIGLDSATFAHPANLLAHNGSWSDSVLFFPNLPAVNTNVELTNPFIVVFYALFAASTGVNAVYLAQFLYLVPLVLAPLGLYLLVQRYTPRRLLFFGLPIAWLAGSWAGTALFYNNALVAAWFGIIPDADYSLIGYLGVLLLLTEVSQGEWRRWTTPAFLSAALVITALSDQLSFLFAAGAMVLFGLRFLLSRDLRHALPRVLLSLLPTVVLLPPYLLPTNASGISPTLGGTAPLGLATLTGIYPSYASGFFGVLGSIAVALGTLGAGLALFPYVQRARGRQASAVPGGLLVFGALALVAMYLSFSNVGMDLLGIDSSRFEEYITIPLVPLVAYAFERVQAKAARRRRRRVAATLGIVALLVAATTLGVQGNFGYTASAQGMSTEFTPELMSAAEWLGEHAAPGSTIVADEMGGNQALQPMSDFTRNAFLPRPRFTLYSLIYEEPPTPWGNPYQVLNQAMEFPSEANLSAAAEGNFSMDYYVFQPGYSNAEISMFSLLPYVHLVYSNPSVDIFEYVGGGGPGFIPAISYENASAGLETLYLGPAYETAFGLPHVPNAVASISAGGAALDGATLTYRVQVPVSENYTLLIHRYAYLSGEYDEVAVDGHFEGDSYFNGTGLLYGSFLNFTLPKGTITLTLTMENTQLSIDPMDYMVLVPES